MEIALRCERHRARALAARSGRRWKAAKTNQSANGSDLSESALEARLFRSSVEEDGEILGSENTRTPTTRVGREKSGGKSRGVRGRRIDEGRKMATTRKDRARIDARPEEGKRPAPSARARGSDEAARGLGGDGR